MKKKNKILIATGMLIAVGGILAGAYALNGSGMLERTNDVTPPYGRISIKGATETNNINYVDKTQIEVEIYAKDDNCAAEDIKYYISYGCTTQFKGYTLFIIIISAIFPVLYNISL